jgi:alpha-N-acetylglucosaminidase
MALPVQILFERCNFVLCAALVAGCSPDHVGSAGRGGMPAAAGSSGAGAGGVTAAAGGADQAGNGLGGEASGSGGAGGEGLPLSKSEQALERILPDHSREFDLSEGLASASGDAFRIGAQDGRIRVEGTSPAVVLAGVGWYLKYVARADLSWPGSSLSRLPATLPLPASDIEVKTNVPHRFALNDTDDGYSGPYRNWDDWEKTIDLLALHGYNEALVTVGQEAVYQATFADFGYSEAELVAWIPAPAHQPWWLMQNMCCVGAPLSPGLMSARVKLGQQIVSRLQELGMTAVFPGYFGTVPPNFPDKNPGASVVPQGLWTVAVPRPDWLDTTSEQFAEVASAFYQHQAALFGPTSMYKMDLLHEGGTAGSVPVPDAAAGVMNALQESRPGATWVLLGWQNNPKAEILNAVDKSRLFIVDGLSDTSAGVDRELKWGGTPYAFGSIPNFGGHTTMGANASTWFGRFEQWRTKADSQLSGIAYMPEGTGTDPLAFELFSELAWRTGALDAAQWFDDYAVRRYGGEDDHAKRAWQTLRTTAYALPSNTVDSDAQDSLFAARPSLTATKAAMWSPTKMRYDGAAFKPALYELLQVEASLRTSDAYQFDVVNVARQALANESRALLPQIAAAYDAKDLATFRVLSAEWKKDLEQLDAIVATDRRFLLGRWLGAARSWSDEPAEQDQLETNARFIITLWYPTTAAAAQLRDYANREYAGLVKDFYSGRWEKYLASLDAALVSNTTPTPIDWYELDSEWVQSHQPYDSEPTGDAHAVALGIADRLAQVVGQRIYDLRPRHTGQCIDAVKGGVDNGTTLQQWTCNGTDAQRFRAEARAGGYFRFVNVKSGKCLEIAGGDTAAGTKLQLWTCNGTESQDFSLQSAAAGHQAVKNRKSGRCLEIEAAGTTAGASLVQNDCNAADEQSFSLN